MVHFTYLIKKFLQNKVRLFGKIGIYEMKKNVNFKLMRLKI